MTFGIVAETGSTVSASSLPIGTSVVLAGVAGKQPWVSFHRLDPGTHTSAALHVGGTELRIVTADTDFDSMIIGDPGDAVEVVHAGVVATTGAYSVTCGYVSPIAGARVS